MEITDAYREHETLPLTKLSSNLMDSNIALSCSMSKEKFPYGKEEESKFSTNHSPSSRSSLCNEEDVMNLGYVYFGDRNTQNGINFIPTEEISDCPTFLENGIQTILTSQNYELNSGDPNLNSLRDKISSENYFVPRDDYSKASSAFTTGKCGTYGFYKIEIPLKKIISHPDMNTADEIKLIEENVRINNILANINCTWSTDSFLSDEYDKGFNMDLDDSDDDLCYRRITSEYPLMTLQTPSDGSLIAVVDFDISDSPRGPALEEPSCSYCVKD